MFHASATRVFNLTTNDFFGRDDLLQGTSEGVYRVVGSIIALIMREGGRSFDCRACDRQGSACQSSADSSTHPNSPYGSRPKAAPLSTPNLSTLQCSVLCNPAKSQSAYRLTD